MLPCPLLVGLLALAHAVQDDPRTDSLVTLDGEFPFRVPATLGEWAARREDVRRRVLVAAGLWPRVPPVPPETEVWGPVQRDGYTVSRITFESLPGFEVTGSLYRPDGAGPFPGVLCPHGHWADGRFSSVSDQEAIAQIERGEEVHFANARFHLQARCAQLARMGCVVLHHDMIGYADSQQVEHWSGFGDVEAELWAMSPFGLQTRNSLQALEVLLSLEDVDPDRIAVTGASGGGTQTFVLGAIDERPDLLFPAVMVSTAMQGGCVCENASHLRVGTGNVEFAALAAPRPLGLTGANDWTIDMPTRGYPELKRLYGLHGAPERVRLWHQPTHPHNYNAVARGHLYRFVNEHFRLGHALPIEEPELLPVHVSDLTVYGDAHPRPAGGIGQVRAALRRIADAERARVVTTAGEDLPAYREVVGGALAVFLGPGAGPGGDLEVQGELDPAEPPLDGTRRVPHGTGSAAFHVTGGLDRARVLSAGPPSPGMAEALADDGGVAITHPLQGTLPTDHRHGYTLYTTGYNLTHIAHRARDLRAIAAHVADGPLALLGEGPEARAALLAAASDPDAFTRVAVELRSFERIDDAADRDFLPGALRWGDAEAYAALVAPTPLLLLGVEQVPEVIRRAYAAAGARDRVRAVPAPDPVDVRAWLLGD